MNENNRLTSLNNMNKVEFTYNKPIASSDLNEVQSVTTSKLSALEGLTNTGFQLKWQRVDNTDTPTIKITDLFINVPYNTPNTDKFQIALPSCNIVLHSQNAFSGLEPDSLQICKLNVLYRLREVNSNSTIYKNGIRKSGFKTPSGSDTITDASGGNIEVPIENNIFDTLLNEEVSTRVIVELTFVLNPQNIMSQVPDGGSEGAWNSLFVETWMDSSRIPLQIDLRQVSGFIGYRDVTGPKLYDYCVMSDRNLLPTNVIKYDQYALILITRQLMKKPANSSTWSFIQVNPTLWTSGTFIKIDKFLDGTSIYDENCTDKSGCVVLDDLYNYRIILDKGVSVDSSSIIYPEYKIIQNSDGTESAQLINHQIIAPTFFTQDKSGAIVNDPDGDLLLSATIDGEIYFRSLV